MNANTVAVNVVVIVIEAAVIGAVTDTVQVVNAEKVNRDVDLEVENEISIFKSLFEFK